MTLTAREILPQIIKFRHLLHQIPEIAGEEWETSKAIRREVEKLELSKVTSFLGTDVVALLQGGKGEGRNVTLRADIDALKLDDTSNCEYSSRHPHLSHACGHDGHSAILLGAARILSSMRDSFAGSVRFVWQPGEENVRMGKDLIEAGALENPRADAVVALHGLPGLALGKIGIKGGASEAACIHFDIVVRGRGGHSSRPHETVDPIVAAAALIMELQTIVSRRINPLHTAVLSIGTVSGGTLANIIPDEVTISGTARYLDDSAGEILISAIRDISEHVAKAHGAMAQVEFSSAYPVVRNSERLAELSRNVVREAIGAEWLHEREEPSMSADDFAYYSRRYEGMYVKLGTGKSALLHQSAFDFPDEAIENGIVFLVNFAIRVLSAP